MRYAKRKTETQQDYTSNKYQPCWTCKKCFGGCSWSKDFEPVPGWQAIPHNIKENGEHANGYRIMYCPLYERG